MLEIGNIELDVPVMQAPLSGYTDAAMRVVAKEHGAPLTFTGVMLDKTLLCEKAVRKGIFHPAKGENPVGGQVLGRDPVKMAKAAAVFERLGYDMIDLNIACPAPKVLRRGRGGALLGEPERVIEIWRRVREAVSFPVTMKLRIGVGSDDGTEDNFWRICETVCDEGIDAVMVHGRTVKKKYKGKADWDIISEVKRRFPETNVIGSGDIFTAEDAVERLRTENVDGVLVARGAIGNPWIFDEIRALLAGEEKPGNPVLKEQGRVILRHFGMVSSLREKLKGVRYFRKFAAGYCKRHPERKKAMLGIMGAKSRDEVIAQIEKWYGVNAEAILAELEQDRAA
ncbi:putative tRNA-dihydrouridine synthase [Anaerohalosphaera lusitana]|uniref:tRNA-dihydrouridine synthase n=1 Tax=Anaerohalosphaera lusitana TaxID=1936003 RepID=A0A1U9NP78_9BACT|nr:tRNA-dihydrouridine synthase family protein [Anaerohalosphaera lusitana]AQT69709.1 putative tRNA-dihydrouridine synthase [Anaerohalosphaera lusitana]